MTGADMIGYRLPPKPLVDADKAAMGAKPEMHETGVADHHAL